MRLNTISNDLVKLSLLFKLERSGNGLFMVKLQDRLD